MKKTLVSVVLITAIVKVFGFLREVFLANYYGSSEIADFYNLTNILPLLIFAPMGTALASAYIPVASSIKTKAEQLSLALSLSLFLFSIALFGTGLSYFFTDFIMAVFAPNAKIATNSQLSYFFTNAYWSFPFVGVSLVLIAYFQLVGSHAKANFSTLFLSLGAIAAIFVSVYTEPKNLAVATPLAYLLQFVFLAYFVLRDLMKSGLRGEAFGFNQHVKKILLHGSLILPSLLLVQSNSIVDRFLSAKLSVTGAISFLSYADRIITLIIGIFLLTSTSILFPKLAIDVKQSNLTAYAKTIKSAITLSIYFVIPVVIGLIAFSEPIVFTIFFRGSFDQSALVGTAGCLFYYSLGLLFIFVKEILMRAIYASENWTKVFQISAVTVVSNVIFSFFLSQTMGVNGIALGTSLANLVSLIFTIYSLNTNRSEVIRSICSANYIWYGLLFIFIALGCREILEWSEAIQMVPRKLSICIVGGLYCVSWWWSFWFVTSRKQA